MARLDTLRLKVTTDATDAVDLVPRIETAVHDTLTTVGLTDVGTLAAAVTAEVMSVIVRVRQATPEETAQAQSIERVRALHRDEYGCGSCAECTHEFGVSYPCPTIRALDGQE